MLDQAVAGYYDMMFIDADKRVYPNTTSWRCNWCAGRADRARQYVSRRRVADATPKAKRRAWK